MICRNGCAAADRQPAVSSKIAAYDKSIVIAELCLNGSRPTLLDGQVAADDRSTLRVGAKLRHVSEDDKADLVGRDVVHAVETEDIIFLRLIVLNACIRDN